MAIDRDLTIGDILKDPHKFGIPTDEEYITNRDYWHKKFFGSSEHIFEMVDKGSETLKGYEIEMKFRFNNFTFDTLEALQQACIDEGYTYQDLNPLPRVVDQTAKRLKFIVDFIPKKKSNILIGV